MFDANYDKLDEAGKEAAEQFFDESLIPSWTQLEARLDVELPVKKKRRRVFAFWIFFAALLGSFLYIGYEGSFRNKAVKFNIAETLPDKHNAKDNQTIAPINTPENDKGNLNSLVNQSTPEGYNNDIVKLSSEEKPSKFSSQQSTNLNWKTKINRDKKAVNVKNSLLKQTFKTNNSITAINENENQVSVSALDEKTNDIKLEEEITTEKIIASPLAETNLINKTILDSSSSGKEKIKNSSSNLPDKSAKKYRTNPGFTIAVTGGTNINSVSFNKFSKAGFDYGLLAGYKLSPKFEIKTGFIFSRKYFTTTGKNISFDSAKLNLPSYTTISLQDATGYCRFIEILVMLYYNFPSKSKTSFYTAAGFSINKMRMENVHYKFLADGSTVVERSHSNANHSSSDFSISVTSNFSVGIKQYLNKQWSISFEPYLRLPLTRFNTSNLKFSTVGISASLILNLPTKKKK